MTSLACNCGFTVEHENPYQVQAVMWHHAIHDHGDMLNSMTIEQLEQWLLNTDKQLGIAESNSIHQEIVFIGSPDRIYEALTNAKQFSEISGGAPTDLNPEAGATFSCFGGMVQGRNVELIPNKRIVQAWRAANWGESEYSLVKFELIAEGTDTRLIFTQTGMPEGQKAHLQRGWHENYWKPLEKYLA